MSDRPVTETTTCYAVLIRRKDGTEFFANGYDASRSLFLKRKEALTCADKLAKGMSQPRRKMRVVKVESIIRELKK